MKEYIERELLLIGVDGCISSLHVQAKGDPIQESAIKLVEATRDYIASLSAADVVEVRHGRWGEYESFPLTQSLNGHPCSECGMHFSTSAIPVMKYCPNCGARMDKEDDHD